MSLRMQRYTVRICIVFCLPDVLENANTAREMWGSSALVDLLAMYQYTTDLLVQSFLSAIG